MDHYHIWCNLRPGIKDLDFVDRVQRYMDHLRTQGTIEGFEMSRRKLGFGPEVLGEFHVVIHVKDLGQLDQAFSLAATRSGDVERLHGAVYGSVTDFVAALYRDFPDPVRVR